MNARKVIFSGLWFVFAAVVLTASATFFAPKWKEYRGYRKKIAELEEAVRKENQRLNTLKQNQEQFQTNPRFVERLAHEHGLARPDDVLFVIPADRDEPAP